jgi:PBP1b-binding outer membrane lipoprotein LpoB
MKPVIKTKIVLLLTALSFTLFTAGCSSAPEVQDDPWNKADDQRARAKQTQDELSTETPKGK